jgi:regulator of protease activity HflC (stomatin/prohibitin superfamily)
MSGIGAIIGFFAVLGFLVGLAGIALVVIAASQNRPVRGGVMLSALGLMFGFILLIISSGVVIVKPGEIAVVYQTFTGVVEPDPHQAGTHIIVPIVQEFVIYDVTQQEYTMSATAGEGAQSGDDSVEARTADGQNVNLDITVIFNVDPNEADVLYPRWGASKENYVNGLIRPTVRTVIRNVVAEMSAEDLYSAGRTAVQTNSEAAAREVFETEGLQLTRLLIRAVNFSDEFSAAIESKQTEQQRLQRAEIEAQRIEVEAQGRAAAVEAQAEGDAQAIRINAEAQAEALRVISEQIAANPLLVQYEYIQKLSDNVSLVLLPSSSPFLFDIEGLMSGLEGADNNFTAPDVPEIEIPDTSN